MTDDTKQSEPRWPERTVIESGVPGITLVHFPTDYMLDTGLPVDGYWSVTWAADDRRMSRATFRTLHAAAHYALRVAALPGALEALASAIAGGGPLSTELSTAMAHAEAHAHECDAAYPAGTLIHMDNGPSIVDDTGTTRQFLDQAPHLECVTTDTGQTVCKECQEHLSHLWPRS